MKRYKMSKGKSRRSFTKGAMHVASPNNMSSPMRGGFRF